MDPAIAVSVIGVLGTGVAAWASVKCARIVNGNGSGNVTRIVERLEEKVDGLVDWKDTHEFQHQAQNALLIEVLRRR